MNSISSDNKISKSLRGRFGTVTVYNSKKSFVFSGNVFRETDHYIGFFNSGNRKYETYRKTSISGIKSGKTALSRFTNY